MIMKYANHIGYSDVNPCEVVRQISPKTLEIRPMKAERDPSYQMDFRPGGFFGTVVNQRDQKWVITPDPERAVRRIRLRKDGRWYDAYDNRYALADEPIHFYDYNF
jgi:hypothetical protein